MHHFTPINNPAPKPAQHKSMNTAKELQYKVLHGINIESRTTMLFANKMRSPSLKIQAYVMSIVRTPYIYRKIY